jgi:hypothetical protein
MSAKDPSRGRGIRGLCRVRAVAVAPVDRLEIVIGKARIATQAGARAAIRFARL